MKKDKIKVYYDVDNKWEMEVFYLNPQDSYPPEYHNNLALGDVGVEQPLTVSEVESMMNTFHLSFLDDEGGELDVNENSAGEGAHGCPVGHKGESGQRGIDEERMYPLILESLEKFSESCCSVDSEVSREVLADGIAKKITRYMWNK